MIYLKYTRKTLKFFYYEDIEFKHLPKEIRFFEPKEELLFDEKKMTLNIFRD